jgi:hypothetical protein
VDHHEHCQGNSGDGMPANLRRVAGDPVPKTRDHHGGGEKGENQVREGQPARTLL